MPRMRARPAALALLLAACARPSAAPPQTPAPAVAPKAAADVDYVMVAPRALVSELAPLIRLREGQGHVISVVEAETIFDGAAPSALALQRAIADADARAHGKLRF